MLFNTPVFISGFLPVTLAGFWVTMRFGSRRLGLLWVLACSLFFYGWWNPVFLLLLVGSILVNYAVGLRVAGSRGWLVAGLVFNLGLLGFFKYANFFAGVLGARPLWSGVFLPLGISFFTFQQIMFLVDAYRDESEPEPLLHYACFVAFFPHLIAGPIVRPRHIIPQFAALTLTGACENVAAGLEIFLLGLAKKVVLADGLARFADPGFAAAARGDAITLVEAWVALLAYALQIYFDFSGYSDMAIGLARMFGIRFPLNFNSPYQARDISDFWRRWNITLSGFLRDYLYIPLGGNRRGEGRRIANLMITMLLGGLWHGAAWRFMLWGGLHGAFLVVHGWFGRAGLRLPAAVSWALTLLCVVLAWVPFRAAGFAPAMDMYAGLAGLHGIALPEILLRAAPVLGDVARGVPVLPYLGDARTLSLQLAILFLALGWTIALGLPQLHDMNARRRGLGLVLGFAFAVQAVFFAPFTVPFLYFQF